MLGQMETYHGKGDKDKHGDRGPINVSKGTYTCKRSEDAFIEASKALGFEEAQDLQNLDANNAAERYVRAITITPTEIQNLY